LLCQVCVKFCIDSPSSFVIFLIYPLSDSLRLRTCPSVLRAFPLVWITCSVSGRSCSPSICLEGQLSWGDTFPFVKRECERGARMCCVRIPLCGPSLCGPSFAASSVFLHVGCAHRVNTFGLLRLIGRDCAGGHRNSNGLPLHRNWLSSPRWPQARRRRGVVARLRRNNRNVKRHQSNAAR
jgi:hypothetical protein